MKKIIGCFLLLYLIYLFIFNKEVTFYLSNISNIFFIKYIASLFPFILITNLFLKSNILIDIHKLLISKKLNFIFDIFIIILTILIGVPGNINLLNYLNKTNIISKKKYDNLLSSFGGISFPFIYLVILIDHQIKYPFIILLIIIQSTLFLLSSKKEEHRSINYFPYKLDIIKQSLFSLGVILFYLLTLSSIYLIFNYLPIPYNYFFNGLIEFSINSINLSNINSLISTMLLCFLLSFTSLSLILQIKSLSLDFNIKNYIKKRAIIALLVTLIIFLLI